jgi:hypothetical protein
MASRNKKSSLNEARGLRDIRLTYNRKSVEAKRRKYGRDIAFKALTMLNLMTPFPKV